MFWVTITLAADAGAAEAVVLGAAAGGAAP
jgi:hypothetical protein